MVFTGQVSTTGGAAATANVAVHVLSTSQVLTTVKVTVLLPPHADGAIPSQSFTKNALQPPVLVAVAFHAAYFALITA